MWEREPQELQSVLPSNPILLLAKKVRAIFDCLLSLVQKEKPTEIVILPKSVRLAIAENNSILTKDEILALLEPKFGLLGVWLVLKFYENDRTVFLEILERILVDFSHDTPPTLWEYLRTKMTQDWLGKQIKTTGKISLISRMGFREFCEALGWLYDGGEWFDSVILVANSGLMGIENILQQLKKNQRELIILFPKFGLENMFYSVSFNWNTLNLRFLNWDQVQDKLKKQKILVIDDISSSWKTEKQVLQILDSFSPNKIEFRTLIKFPDKREFMTDPHRGMVC